jgi:hypothetical protein
MFALLHFSRCTLENVSSKHQVTTSKKNIVDRMLHSPISQRQTAAPERELQPHSQPDGELGAEMQPLHARRKRITPVFVWRDRVKSLSVYVLEEILRLRFNLRVITLGSRIAAEWRNCFFHKWCSANDTTRCLDSSLSKKCWCK